jgi:hypothetical protein
VRYLAVVHPTEAYFPTVAGVIATLIVALVFGWQRPRQRGLSRFGIVFMFSLIVLVPASFLVAFDGMTKDPFFPAELAVYLTEGVVGLLLGALIPAFVSRAENQES